MIADESGSEGGDSDNERLSKKGGFGGKKVLKSSFASAFNSIINKKIDEDKTEQPILAKYKGPAKEVSEEQKRESELKQKRLEKER